MNSAKFAFYYMLSLVTLFIMSLSLGNILFEVINKFFPDITRTIYYYNNSGLKGSISGILISTPIFYFIMSKIYKSLKIGELKKDSEVRRWLTYFILFISSVVVIGSLIQILNNFLDGAFTMNFILKTLTVLSIASLIFGFYFNDIKRGDFKSDKVNKIFFFVSLIIMTSAFIASFFLIESPTEARNRKLDEKIIQDFDAMRYAIDSYYSKNKTLPQNLEDIKIETINSRDLNFDNSKEYDYKITGEETYELCANFLSSNLEKTMSYSDTIWKHDKGYQCIKKEVNHELK